MLFEDSVRQQAFKRSGGKCECASQHEGERSPHHGGKCPRAFFEVWGWEVNHITTEERGGKSTLENAQVLCLECYQLAKAAKQTAAR